MSTILWDATYCNMTLVYNILEEATSSISNACCLVGLLFNPENGSSIFLQMVSKLLPDYTVTYKNIVHFTVITVRISHPAIFISIYLFIYDYDFLGCNAVYFQKHIDISLKTLVLQPVRSFSSIRLFINRRAYVWNTAII
jgi:hypothetical protein